MLGQVREEMEELQASRDFWEDRALHSDSQIQSLNNSVRSSFFLLPNPTTS
jgi:small subunit ribosomal protein S2e